MKSGTEEYRINGEELRQLLDEKDMNVPTFAALEAKLNPQTIYSALKGEKLKRKSFVRISDAMERMKGTATAS